MSAIGKLRRTKLFFDRTTKLAAFRKKARNPMPYQWAFLQNLLRRHQDTDFGRQHGFSSIQSIEDYQERVPIHSWEEIAPYIEAVQNGDSSALFPTDEKLLMYAATSGTTGEPKYIPVTQTSYRNYGKYWDLFWSQVGKDSPTATDYQALYFPGDPAEGYINDVPFGAITAKAYEQQNPLLRAMYPYPYQICRISDYQIRYYTMMRIALGTQISIIPVANPSTIITVFKVAEERASDIIDDIRTGRLRYADHMPSDVAELIMRRLRPNKRRADELEYVRLHNKRFLPKDYWPHPMTICCFAGGPLRVYLRQLKNYLDHYKVFDFGLLASEGRLSFGVGSVRQQKGCPLTLESNFFEFIPEEDIAKSSPRIVTLDQVEKDHRYFIIFTNYSGLYRYNISDMIQVTGFYENLPMITFCNKGKHMSNITGEKLTEYQVTESVRRAENRTGYALSEFTVCLHWDEETPYYTLLKDGVHHDTHDGLQSFINCVDEELMKLNIEYRSKRESLRLGPLALKTVGGLGFHEYEKKKRAECHNLSQYKPAFLISDTSFEGQFHIEEEITSTAKTKVA